jgi:hypothetical protein
MTDPKKRQDLLADLRSGGINTITDVANVSNLSVLDIISAGGTQEAQLAMVRHGVGIRVATGALMRTMDDSLRDLLRGEGLGDLANHDGPITMDLLNGIGNMRKRGDIQREMRRMVHLEFGISAESYSEMALGQAIAENVDDPLRAYIGTRVDMADKLSRFGKTSGMQNLLTLSAMVADGKKTADAKGVIRSFFGVENPDEIYAAMAGDDAQNMYKEIMASSDTTSVMAFDIMYQTLITGKLGGEAVSDKKRNEIISVITGKMEAGKRKDFYKEIVRKGGSTKQMRDYALSAAEVAANVQDDNISRLFKDEAQDYAANTRMLELLGDSDFMSEFSEDSEFGWTGFIESETVREVIRKKQAFIQKEGDNAMQLLEKKGPGIMGVSEADYKVYEKFRKGMSEYDELMGSLSPNATFSVPELLQKILDAIKGFNAPDGDTNRDSK